MPTLEGKTAVVAAASGGLGKAIAHQLLVSGAQVAICSRDKSRIEAAAADLLQATGKSPLALVADVTNPKDIQNAVEQVLRQFGAIDILVTNAGGPPAGAFDDFDDDVWMAAHELNLMSVVRFVRAVLPTMKRQNGGSIVNISSSSVKEPQLGLLLSNTYRSAVIGLAKTLSLELASHNIRVNNVAPGRIDTDRVRYLDEKRADKLGISYEQSKADMVNTIPLGRYGTPVEFANVVAFLASEESSYITGVTLQVDGGMIRSMT